MVARLRRIATCKENSECRGAGLPPVADAFCCQSCTESVFLHQKWDQSRSGNMQVLRKVKEKGQQSGCGLCCNCLLLSKHLRRGSSTLTLETAMFVRSKHALLKKMLDDRLYATCPL